jgi:GON domain-containing protein
MALLRPRQRILEFSGLAVTIALATLACGGGSPTSVSARGSGNPNASAVFPTTCNQVREALRLADAVAVINDGLYTLHANGTSATPWTAYCRGMRFETPEEYLVVSAAENYSEASYAGSVMRTRYDRLRVLADTLDVDALDTYGASTENVHPAAGRSHLPAGFAHFSGPGPSASGRIDIRGTPFRFAVPAGTSFLCTNGPGGPTHLTMLNADRARVGLTAFTLESGSLVTTWAQLGCGAWTQYPSVMRWRLEYEAAQ